MELAYYKKLNLLIVYHGYDYLSKVVKETEPDLILYSTHLILEISNKPTVVDLRDCLRIKDLREKINRILKSEDDGRH